MIINRFEYAYNEPVNDIKKLSSTIIGTMKMLEQIQVGEYETKIIHKKSPVLFSINVKFLSGYIRIETSGKTRLNLGGLLVALRELFIELMEVPHEKTNL